MCGTGNSSTSLSEKGKKFELTFKLLQIYIFPLSSQHRKIRGEHDGRDCRKSAAEMENEFPVLFRGFLRNRSGQAPGIIPAT